MKFYNLLTLFFLFTFSISSYGQIFSKKNYPKGYFIWPVDAKIALAANFGELRPNHYHMGLDCKTDQVQNKRVFAAADGYIAKVKIEPSGFGRCIYINHPNGLTTLYAHLNNFNPALEKYITEQQYKLQKWRIFIDIPVNLFPVKQGEFIAYSGSTGGSEGPHTHFEIRDTKTDKVLNPLLFGFPIVDNIPPDILRLAVYDRNISTYEQMPKIYLLKKINGVYTPPIAVLMEHTNKVSFAITAYDRYVGATHQNGIYEAVLYDNETPIVGFEMDSISYDETRDVNAHIDYKLKNSGGPFVQHLSQLPGYTKSIYKQINGDGVINIGDTILHQIKIAVIDAYGNTSFAKFSVRGTVSNNKITNESIKKSNEFLPNSINIFENNALSFYLTEKSLYDSIRFNYNVHKANTTDAVSDVFELANGNIPVHGYFPIKIKSNISSIYKDKILMEQYWASKKEHQKAILVTNGNNNWYFASFRAFGYFTLLLDTLPPSIKPIGFKDGMNCASSNRIAFSVVDNNKEVQNFKATLDGNWLRFTNDKNLAFIYIFDEHCSKGLHELKISVEDLVGNKTEKIYHFTR